MRILHRTRASTLALALAVAVALGALVSGAWAALPTKNSNYTSQLKRAEDPSDSVGDIKFTIKGDRQKIAKVRIETGCPSGPGTCPVSQTGIKVKNNGSFARKWTFGVTYDLRGKFVSATRAKGTLVINGLIQVETTFDAKRK